MPSTSIYLDNAATSFPKPACVYDAMDRYHRESGVAVGRGAYRQAVEVQGEVDRCRQRVAQLFNAESPQRIIFTFNCTDSLNLAIHGVLRQGDHVITSVLEHNSVLRPLHELQRDGRIDLTLITVDPTGVVNPDDFRQALRPNTRLIALTHASNVSGAIQPCAEVGQIARVAGVIYLIDAAQTAGHLPIDVRALSADMLACPGHKALMGPLGTGLLYTRPGIESDLRSMRQGGTGTRSEVEFQPATLPDKYEAGNHN
ncbi:MAG: csd 1, partial [Planctomycetaceae bacterium]|nr:csd 1 [Planctomycetaceae bacterium]